jgi:FAD/FMN-containing dehydrogenase
VSSAPPTTYWSLQQSAVQPYCTFTPTTALEVSTTVLLARLFTCPFAVKSGGHAAFAGASSIEGGITIDLAGLNERKLSDDRKTVAIGSGNRWVDVYDYLTPYELAVVGGRVCHLSDPRITLQ